MIGQTPDELSPLDLPERPDFTHRAHRFPGKFHPPLISQIIEQNPDSKLIADPMCGSGTTGVEAVVAGRDAICMDIDPLCTLMTRAKTRPVSAGDLRALRDKIISGAGEMPEEGELSNTDAKAVVRSNLKGTQYCVPYNLHHWFEPYVSVGFSLLLFSAHEQLQDQSERMKDAIHTSLAAMVRQISRADPDPVSGLEVTKVRKKELEEGVDFDVLGSFNNVVERLARGYDKLNNLENEIGSIEVVEEDAKKFSKVCLQNGLKPQIIVSSPPYCNAIEYHRRHRLEYEWLGLFNNEDIDDHRSNRIETSRDFFGSTTSLQETLKNLESHEHDEISELMDKIARDGKQRKANLLRKYFLDAYDWLKEMNKALEKGGYLYLIVGPSTSYGHTVPTPRFLTEIAVSDKVGFEKVESQRYELTNNKMQYPTDGDTTELEALIKFKAR